LTFVADFLKQHFHWAQTTIITWPSNEKHSLTIEVINYSLQVAFTLLYGLAFFELKRTNEPSFKARKQLVLRIVYGQLIMGLVAGLAFFLITVWRVKSGDSEPPPPGQLYGYFEPALLGQAIFPSVIAPLLFIIWAYGSAIRVPKTVLLLMMSLLGGAMLGFNQFTYEMDHPATDGSEYYAHEFIFGFCLVFVCLSIHILNSWLEDASARAPTIR